VLHSSGVSGSGSTVSTMPSSPEGISDALGPPRRRRVVAMRPSRPAASIIRRSNACVVCAGASVKNPAKVVIALEVIDNSHRDACTYAWFGEALLDRPGDKPQLRPISSPDAPNGPERCANFLRIAGCHSVKLTLITSAESVAAPTTLPSIGIGPELSLVVHAHGVGLHARAMNDARLDGGHPDRR
jgi:hypothetical protein